MRNKIFLVAVLSIGLFSAPFFLRKALHNFDMKSVIRKTDEMTTFRLKESIVNIGDIPLKGGKVRRAFTIYNTGPNNLIIYDVKPDCKCTVGSAEKDRVIQENDSTQITLEYNPTYPGIFQVSAVVELNVESAPLLVMRGNVLP